MYDEKTTKSFDVGDIIVNKERINKDCDITYYLILEKTPLYHYWNYKYLIISSKNKSFLYVLDTHLFSNELFITIKENPYDGKNV